MCTARVRLPKKGVKKEDAVRPYLQRMERQNQHGVYGIFTCMEMVSTRPMILTIASSVACAPATCNYFYIRDPVMGAMAMCVDMATTTSKSNCAAKA